MNPFAIPSIFSASIVALFGVFVSAKDFKTEHARLFLVYSITVSFCAFTEYCVLQAESVGRAVFWSRMGYIWPIMPALQLHFALSFVEEKSFLARKWLSRFLLYAPAVFFPTYQFLTVRHTPMVMTYWGYKPLAKLDLPHTTMILWSMTITCLVVYLSLKKRRHLSSPQERGKIMLVMIGLVIPTLWGTLSKGVMPRLGMNLPQIGAMGFAVGCVFISYAMWRYRLFELTPETAAGEIVATMPDALLLLNHEQRIVAVNQATITLLGYQESHLIGGHADMVSPNLRYPCDGVSDANASRVVDFETEARDQNGNTIPVSMSRSPAYDNDGKCFGSICILRDIRKRKHDEMEKAKLASQLQQAQKMESVGKLAGGIAHDFNNMLGAIMGFADLIRLKAQKQMPDLSSFAENIVKTSKRASDLTVQLLAFARKGRYNIVPTDLHQIVRDVISLLERTIDKRIRFIHSLSASPHTIMADASQMQNAVLNLGVNARDAMPDGGELTFVTKTVQLDEGSPGDRIDPLPAGEYLLLSVTDTGVGMPKNIQSRIFEPFFTTKSVGKGTGLGLAGVYGTVKSHGGSVEVCSEPGQGTTFKLYLPAMADIEEGAARDGEDIEYGSGTVLVVDDEESMRLMARALLKVLGYETVSKSNGVEAVAYFRDHHPEIKLVLLDLVMPEMDGQDCFEKMREIDPAVRVIISSGYAVDGGASRIVEKGALGFIQKPFDLKRLSRAVSRAVAS